jgi:hypothetical protein
MGPKLNRFHIDGAVKELIHLADKLPHEEDRLKQRMFSSGAVPVLDITPIVEHSYVEDKGTYRYTITMYGVKVEGDAWRYEGWLNGELIEATIKTRFGRLLSHSGLK